MTLQGGRQLGQANRMTHKQAFDSRIVLEDATLRCVQSIQETLLEVQESCTEFALKTKEIGTLFVDFRTFHAQDLRERLRLQACTRDLRAD